MDGMFNLDLISTGIKTMAILFIVIALLILVLHFLKKSFFLKQGTKGNVLIKVLSSFHFSPKERIEIIEISGEKIVLGITPGKINFLTKLDNSPGEEKHAHGKGQGASLKKK